MPVPAVCRHLGGAVPCVMTSRMTWFAPAFGPVRDRLAATIDRFAAEHDSPRFQPHLTMIGTFDSGEDVAVRTLESLVIGVPPLDVTFAAVGPEPAYFRSLYLSAEPSGHVTALHEADRRAWALDSQPPTSLVNGTLSDTQHRQATGVSCLTSERHVQQRMRPSWRPSSLHRDLR